MKSTVPDTESSLRRFGLTVGLGFIIVGAISRYRGHEWAPLALACLAAPLLGLAILQPRLLGGVKKVWMGLGNVLGWINTRIILTCLFVVVVSPVSLLMRIFRDPLNRHREDEKPSYWLPKTDAAPKTQTPAQGACLPRYERQF